MCRRHDYSSPFFCFLFFIFIFRVSDTFHSEFMTKNATTSQTDNYMNAIHSNKSNLVDMNFGFIVVKGCILLVI